MRDLDKALSDITEIRGRIVAATCFQGLGPAALAVTGGLAVATAVAQTLLLDDPTARPVAFFGGWIATAVVAAVVLGVEMVRRARRLHGELGDDMVFNAALQFLPAGAAGAALAAVVWRFAPEAAWMLPGLWAVLSGLGIFAFARALPGPMMLAGAWYFVAGFTVLMVSAETRALSPWAMGVPFAVGQLLMAAIARFFAGGPDGQG